MNQTQEQLEELAHLDAQAAAFQAAGRAAEQAESLRQALVIQGRASQLARIASETRQRGAEAVAEAKPALADWRQRFQKWVSDGHQLAQELAQVEQPLFLGLRNLTGGIRQAKGQAENIEEGERLAGVAERESLDALREIGGLDVALSPWPGGGNQFARDLTGLMARHVGAHTAVFDPAGGIRQFVSRRTLGAW